MEEFQILFGLFAALLAVLVFVAPIISLIGFLRARQLRETVAALEDTVRALDARVEVLARAQARMKTAAPGPEPALGPAPFYSERPRGYLIGSSASRDGW